MVKINLNHDEDKIVSSQCVGRNFDDVTAIADISFSVVRGDVLGIIGRSGAGKSTLLRCLAGLEKPDHGKIVIGGRDTSSLSNKELLLLRRKIGLVFQHFNLLSSRTVIDNIALPLKIAGENKNRRIKRALELLDVVGLRDSGLKWPSQLSGGQKQRVGIARALAGNPELLLCDEATSALDPETTRSILGLLREINQSMGLTIILITHEMSVVQELANHVLVMNNGRIVEYGPAAKIFTSPAHQITKQLLKGMLPRLPDDVREQLVTRKNDRCTHSVIRVDLLGDIVRRPLLSWLQQKHGIEAVLLEARIYHIGKTPAGTMFLGIPIDFVKHVVCVLAKYEINHVEKLGYVELYS